jgi:hypothetical protein
MDSYQAALLGLVIAREVMDMQQKNKAVTADEITKIILRNKTTIDNILTVVKAEIKEYAAK